MAVDKNLKMWNHTLTRMRLKFQHHRVDENQVWQAFFGSKNVPTLIFAQHLLILSRKSTQWCETSTLFVRVIDAKDYYPFILGKMNSKYHTNNIFNILFRIQIVVFSFRFLFLFSPAANTNMYAVRLTLSASSLYVSKS